MIGRNALPLNVGSWFRICVPALLVLALSLSNTAEAQQEGGRDLLVARERLADQANRLAARADATAAELAGLRSALVAVSSDIVAGYNALDGLDREIDELTERHARTQADLARLRTEAAEIALARSRIESMPPVMALTSPMTPADAVRAEILLEALVDGFEAQAAELAEAVEEEDRLERILAERRRQLELETGNLAREMESLDRLLENRRRLLTATESEREEVGRALTALTRRITSPDALIEALPTIRDQNAAEQPDDIERSPTDRNRSPVQATAGEVLIAYGERNDDGEQSDGVWIATPPAGPVVAPLSGIVRFAGEFRGMGLLLILEHTPQYHTLIGRLGDIDVEIGQEVITGEPIGRTGLPDDRHNRQALLYVEVRRNAAPVDPAVGLADAHASRF